MLNLKAVVEALLFSSQRPLTSKEILQVIRLGVEYVSEEEQAIFKGITEATIQTTLVELSKEYEQLERAFQLAEQVNGWQLATKPEHQNWVRQLFPDLRPARLSPPALETLAIVAYRQPVTKADIEAIRGVAVDGVIQRLLDVGMLKIAGRAEIPGRPLLYETTQHFMEHFGIKNLDELPNASELRYIPLPNGMTAPTNEPEPGQLFNEASQDKDTNPEPPAEPPSENVTSENVTEVAAEPGSPIDLSDVANLSDVAKGGDGAKSEGGHGEKSDLSDVANLSDVAKGGDGAKSEGGDGAKSEGDKHEE